MTLDGRSIYVSGGNTAMLGILQRTPESGQLAQAAGRAGCIAAEAARREPENHARACAPVDGFAPSKYVGEAALDVAVSPDGRNVYLATGPYESDLGSPFTVLAFARAADGTLSRLPDSAGCIASAPLNGCAVQPGLTAASLSVSPDGAQVYAGGDTLTTFARDAAGGLTTVGCISAARSRICTRAPLRFSIEAPIMSADSRTGYARATSSRGDALVVLARGPGTGSLEVHGCVTGVRVAGCRRDRRLLGRSTFITGLALSPDGRHLYVVATPMSYDVPPPRGTPFVIAGYKRVAPTGALKPAPRACLHTGRRRGCRRDRRLPAPNAPVVSPTGRRVYVSTIDGVVVLRRNTSSGGLRRAARVRGCEPPGPCRTGRGPYEGANGLLLAPDGRYLYVIADGYFATGTVSTLAVR